MAKKDKAPKVKETTSILLNVPNEIYYRIKRKADEFTYMNPGKKRTIHDQMIMELKEK